MKNDVFAFIDAENVRNSLEELGYKDLDYKKLFKWLTEVKGASRVYLYLAFEEGDKEKEANIKSLKRTGYFVSSKKVVIYKQRKWKLPTTCPKCKNKFVRDTFIKDKRKANCDAEMTLDIIRFGVRHKYKGIIVFSGDGDFASVYEYVSSELKREVTVYSPMGKLDKRTSYKIKELAKKGVLKIEDLNSLTLHYAIK